MSTPITNADFSAQFADLQGQYQAGSISEAAFTLDLTSLVNNWTMGATDDTQLGILLSQTLANWNNFVAAQLAWLTTPPNGGTYGNGSVDVPDYLGNITNVEGLQGLEAVTQTSLLLVGDIVEAAGPESGVSSDRIVCDGRAVSRSLYPDLFTKIGTTFGVGDGSTTFNVPDRSSEFVSVGGVVAIYKAIKALPKTAMLGSLALSVNTGTAGSSFSATLSGRSPGSSLALTDSAGGIFSLSGLTVSGTPSSAGTYTITVTETLAGALYSPRSTSFSITIASGTSPGSPTAAVLIGSGVL